MNVLVIIGAVLLLVVVDRTHYAHAFLFFIGSGLVTFFGIGLKTPYVARFGHVLLGGLVFLATPIGVLARNQFTESDRDYLWFWFFFVSVWIVLAIMGRLTGKRLLYGFMPFAYPDLKAQEREEMGDFFVVRRIDPGDGKTVKISWTMAEGFPPLRWSLPNRKNCRLLGYRSEERFDPERKLESGRFTIEGGERTWVADGTKNKGAWDDELEPGKEYFYTFFVRAEEKGKVWDFDRVMFSVRVPRAQATITPAAPVIPIEVPRPKSKDEIEYEELQAEIAEIRREWNRRQAKGQTKDEMETDLRASKRFHEAGPEKQRDLLDELNTFWCERE